MVLLEMLEEVDFLKGILPEYRGMIAGLGELKEAPPNTVLFQEGMEAHSVYLVLEGDVALEMYVPGEGAVVIQAAGAGELVGWSPALRLGPVTATARTRSRCRLVGLNVGRLLNLFQTAPHFGMEFLRRAAATMARRLSATRRRLLALSHTERSAVG
jgi:CRP-like cAMP-binding protein